MARKVLVIGAQWLGTFMALAHPDMASSAGPLGAETSDRTVVVNGTLPDIAWARAHTNKSPLTSTSMGIASN